MQGQNRLNPKIVILKTNSSNSTNILASGWLMAVLVLSISIVSATTQPTIAQELTSGLSLRPHIENLNAKHDDAANSSRR